MASSISPPPPSSRVFSPSNNGSPTVTTTAPAAVTPNTSSSLTSSGPPPVDILSSPAAQTYAHAHPALLLALYALRFPALVADPVSTLTNDLPLYTALQVAYVVICLPQAGSSPSSHSHHEGSNTEGAGGDSKKTSSSTSATAGGRSLLKAGKTPYRKKTGAYGSTKGGNEIFGKLTAAFLSLTLTFLLGTPVLAILLVLFGAPFTTHVAHTLLCAAHMSLLSVTMLVYVHGVDGAAWRQVWALARPADVVWGGALGTCVGAWLGAVPIPLDWDRPWQEYPITILTGAYIGFAVGSLIARTPLLFGKRIEFTSSSEGEETAAPQDHQNEPQ